MTTMQTTTVKITNLVSGKHVLVPNTTFFKAYLFQVVANGQLKAIFKAEVLKKHGIVEKAKLYMHDPDGCIGDDKLREALFRANEKGSGYEVVDIVAEREAREEEKMRGIIEKKVPIMVGVGIFGFRLSWLPKEVYATVSEYGNYHVGNAEDREDAFAMGVPYPSKNEISGWFYEPEAVDVLVKAGYQLRYNGHTLKSMRHFRSLLAFEQKRVAA